MKTVLVNQIATATNESTRVEAIRAVNELKADGTIDEAEALDAIDELNALVFGASSSSSKKSSWMTDEDDDAVISRPEGFLETPDMVKIALSSVILAMKFYSDAGKTALVMGDDPILNTLAIRDALMGDGSGYLELANGISVSLNANSLPKDNFGKFVMPNLGDSVRVARLVRGQCTITSQHAPIGRKGNSPYRIFEHDGIKYSGVVKPVVYKLLSIGSQVDEAKLNVISKLTNISAKEALEALGL